MLPLKEYIKHPEIVGYRLLQQYFTWLPDKLFIQLMFRLKMGYWPDLKNPQTFSEKLQWLKLYNRKPEYTTMVDKYAVKEYVANIIGEEYIIPTLGVWDKPEDIEWDKLPDQFVLKTTHGGGSSGVVICKDKYTFDKDKAIVKLNRSMRQDIYRDLKEWPYKNVPKRVIVEKYISPNPKHDDLPDYKFFCFNGKAKYCQVITGRNTEECVDFFDYEWKHQSFHEPQKYPFASTELQKPACYEKLWEMAERLAEGKPFSRIDFYNVDDNVFFGEITFFPTSGMGGFNPEDYDKIMGRMISLPGKCSGGAILKFKVKSEKLKVDKASLKVDDYEMEVIKPDLPDYKFFCFDGEVKALFIGTERQTGNVKFDYFDADFNHLDLIQQHPMSRRQIPKPENYVKMKELAAKLSEGIPQVRIDLYDVNGKIYFGEMTFYHHGGIVPFHPIDWDYKFGSWIKLPEKYMA